MKQLKNLLITILLLTFNFTLFADNNHNQSGRITNGSSISECDSQLSISQTVYLCSGSYSYAYHSRSNCPGLINCKGEINYTDEFSAVNSFGRRPCCRCWSNVLNNCKDDNPYYGGGGGDNSEAYAYLALAIIATSAIILSNDLYVYPTYSFYKGASKNNYYGQQSSNGNGTGWIFGFRKTFKRSALEYGASYLKFETKNYYGYGYTDISLQNRWGGHFNYVHQVFYSIKPDWLILYTGPSVNFLSDFGFGGIVGSSMKLFDRLRFDVRYELTSQTNQIQAGLIFTYQKKYFWRKK